MFGLMKVSTHEAAIDAKDAKIADLKLVNLKITYERDAAKTRASTAEAEVVTLKGWLKDVTLDRDNWKQSESDCNAQYDKVKAENVALKARIAELEKPVPLPKRKPVGGGSVKSDGKGVSINAAKVPVKGKVK